MGAQEYRLANWESLEIPPPRFVLGVSGDGGHQVFLGLVVLYVKYRYYFIANLRSFRIERRLSWAGGVPSEISEFDGIDVDH